MIWDTQTFCTFMKSNFIKHPDAQDILDVAPPHPLICYICLHFTNCITKSNSYCGG